MYMKSNGGIDAFMSKSLYIAEKPSVAREFAKALNITGKSYDGYMESSDSVVTWCVGHLVTMSYPESYDPALRRWTLETLPFIPGEFKYEIIDSVKKQFEIVSRLLNRPDVDIIYVCTDSGREGEYIYRLVDQMANVHGSIHRQKKKFFVVSVKPKTFPSMIIWQHRLICVLKKIISWE